MINIKVQNDASYLIKRYKKGFRFVRAKALQACVNEVIKYTLPSNQHSKGTAKQQANGFDYNKQSASKIGGTIKRNIKHLQARIQRDILGDGKNLPTAYPTPKTGKIIKGTLTGSITSGAFVIVKPRTKNKTKIVNGKKKTKQRKNAKKYTLPKNYTDNAKTLIEHIKKNTYLKGGNKTAKRLIRRGTKLMWVKNAKVAKDAALNFIYMGGFLLSGWTAAQNAVGRLKVEAMGSRVNMLKDILQSVKLRRTNAGLATVHEDEDETGIAAINPNVAKAVSGYQQRMINSVIESNLKKHVENEIHYLTKKIAAEIKQRIRENYKKP